MELLTIGAFARATRLSPKALRLYAELGLLRPARVDPASGYRYYAAEQLDQARLVAWLRRLGMPLARIAAVLAADGATAAAEVAAYWRQVEADTAVRRELAALLVHHLSGEDTTMTDDQTPLALRCAARSDRGLVRPTNADVAHADATLLAVADGFGDGGAASTAAVEALTRVLEQAAGPVSVGDVLAAVDDAVAAASDAVHDLGPDTGTTLTALVRSGSRLALVHVGDSRAYLLRDGALRQLTHDHTLVQSMIDEGTLTAEEATSHPQRSLLVRALGIPRAPDIAQREARAGDRYLLCSDGLHVVVGTAEIEQVLAAEPDPDQAVGRLVDLARAAGGPDNVACVVADVVA